MRIKLTFDLDAEQRRAIARRRKHRRPVSRTEAVQFITETVATEVGGAVAELRQAEQEPDRRQLKLFDQPAAAAATG